VRKLDGVDLWHFTGAKKAGVVNAFRYLTPFLVDQSGWKKPQITKYDPKGHFFPGLAGAALRDAHAIKSFRQTRQVFRRDADSTGESHVAVDYQDLAVRPVVELVEVVPARLMEALDVHSGGFHFIEQRLVHFSAAQPIEQDLDLDAGA
jgi:hypothetical protein